MKVHVVDGTYELFRSFYGAPPQNAPDGSEVGATVGLLRSLLVLLREPDVTHVACAFDHVIESFRNDLFDGYKTGEGIDPDLFGQFEIAEEATRALGITVWPMVEFEADDALATAAARWSRSRGVDQVVICSPDKDLAQCVVRDRVVTLDRRRKEMFDEAAVVGKFGVSPGSIPDWLALVGDSADGIPGIPGWGAKSSASVLSHWKRIDRIPGDSSKWQLDVRGAARLAANLRERKDDALLYRELATLRLDVPLDEDLDDLEWRGALRAELQETCETLGVPALVDRVSRWRS